jgi:triacylglycerol lipase
LRSAYQGAKFFITGHSLGGAMSIFCTLDMKSNGIDVDGVYNYGQPRLGNQNFANFLGALNETYRVINYGDLVPHVPPTTFGFRHGNT